MFHRSQSETRTTETEVVANLVPESSSPADGVRRGNAAAGIWGAQTFPVRAPTRSTKVPTLDRQANSDFVDELLEDFRREQEPHLPNVKSRCRRAWDASRRRKRCRSCVLAIEFLRAAVVTPDGKRLTT